MPAGSARTRGTVLAVAAAALLGGVLVLRPDVATGPADLVTDARPPLDPGRLAGTPVQELTVAADGVGPLLLGTPVEDLLAVGWRPPSPDVPGAVCARLPRTEVDGGVLTGWASDGAVVAVQLEVTGRPSAAPAGPVGAALGTPVDDAAPARLPGQEPVDPVVARDRVAGETGTVDVGSATWALEASTVTVSDLGTGAARVVEVAAPGGSTCRLTPEVLGAEGDRPLPRRGRGGRGPGRRGVRPAGPARVGHPHLARRGPSRTGDTPDVCAALVGAVSGPVVTGEHPEGAELAVRPPDGLLYGLASGTRARTTRSGSPTRGPGEVTRLWVDLSSVVVEEVDSFAVVQAAARSWDTACLAGVPEG